MRIHPTPLKWVICRLGSIFEGRRDPPSSDSSCASSVSHGNIYPRDSEHPACLVCHVLSSCMPLHIPLPSSTTEEHTPLVNSSFLSFKVKIKGLCCPCSVPSSTAMFFHLGWMFCPRPLLWTQSKPFDFLWPRGWGRSDGQPTWGLDLKETHYALSSAIAMRTSPPSLPEDKRDTWSRAKSPQWHRQAQLRSTSGQWSPRHVDGLSRAA